jgi:hypothetical protein
MSIKMEAGSMSPNPQKGGVVYLLIGIGPPKSRAGSKEIDILKLVLVCPENALWQPTSPWHDSEEALRYGTTFLILAEGTEFNRNPLV